MAREFVWFSINTDTPPEDVQLLVYCPELVGPDRGDGVTLGRYNASLGELIPDGTRGFAATHWMYKPEPPGRRGRKKRFTDR